jgi:thiamine kinase-like enzyme
MAEPARETLPRAAEAAHIAAALRRAGMLHDAQLCAVTLESARPTILSRIVRLRLSYDGPAAGAPNFVILKTGLPERIGSGWKAGLQEVEFYSRVAPATRSPLFLRCFEAHWDAASEQWHLLLEDLADTHAIATIWPLPPTEAQCEMIVDALARFHAAWWDNPRLGGSIGTWRDEAASAAMLQDLGARFARFAVRLGDVLPRERRALYERLLEVGPRLLGRYHTHRDVTLIHGDAHAWNVFMPRTGGDDVRLFDWDSWRIGVAASDLAYLMALHWYPDRRRRLERRLLDRYHSTLLEQGVGGYDRNALDEDYRWAALWQITTPVWQATYDIPAVIWWNHMERIMLAVDDLGCRELLG